MSTDVNRCVQNRRERGRAAQAAFRKRQIDTIHVQEEQLRSFDQLLKDVNEATSKLKTAMQVSAGHEKDDVPNHIVQELISELEHALQRAQPTKLWKAKGKDDEGMSMAPATLIHQETLCRATSNTSPPEKVMVQEVPITVGQAIRPGSIGSDHFQNNTREDTTFWMTHTLSSSDFPIFSLPVPPLEIVPYLSPQPGSRPTFASKLFWATMSLGYRLASGTENMQFAPRLLLYHLRFHTAKSIAGRIGRMLLTESTGVTHQDSTPHFTYRMIHHIVRDLVLEGEDVKGYLDAQEVELYFWRRGFDPISLEALGVTDADWRLSELLQELSRNAVCFGDGPKYLLCDIEKAFLHMTGGMSIFPCLSV